MVSLSSRTDPPERLLQHALTFRTNRFTGPLLNWGQLTLDERRWLFNLAMGSQWDRMPELLNLWGVMCPHPKETRLYGGHRAIDYAPSFEEEPWFSCGVCRTRVVNRGA